MTKTRDLADLGGGFIQAGTGAQQRTVESKLQDVVSVKDFGDTGTGDDTAVFTLADSNGIPYFVPEGSYVINSVLTNTSAYTTGDVTITGTGGIKIVNVIQPTLPKKNVIYPVTGDLPVPKDNILFNPRFTNFPFPSLVSVAAGQDKYVCGNWRIKASNNSSTGAVDKIQSISGGLSFTATFGTGTDNYLYVRQLTPNILPLSGKTYTLTADVEVDVACQIDAYILARRDVSDLTRIPIIDTDFFNLSPGRQTVSVTFDVPTFDSTFASNIDVYNALSTALRFYGTSTVVNIKVYEIVITPGTVVSSGVPVSGLQDQLDSLYYYETGRAQITGFSTVAGQKRYTRPLTTPKINIPFTTTISDLAGTTGVVSTYDGAGIRTDGVTPTQIISDGKEIGVIVSNASTAAGVAFDFVVNCYP